MFCEGGFYGGHLKPSDKIKSILKPMTASFGITALNELQELYNGKSIREDGEFALEVMKYINNLLLRFRGATVRCYLASAACRMLQDSDTDVLAID